MPRVRLLHWNAREAAGDLKELKAAGYEVDYDEAFRPGMMRAWRESPPAAFVIDLSRLPSHGREIAILLRQSPVTRRIPLVFCEGSEEKVQRIRTELPDAVYCTGSNLKSAVRTAIANRPENPVVPKQMMDRYASRTAAQKLGIRPGTTVALVNPPRDFRAVLGEMPERVDFAEEPETGAEVTLCFVHDAPSLGPALSNIRHLAASSKLWILWKKRAAKTLGSDTGLSERLVREIGIDLGLVDYKICSVNPAWSGLLFAARRSPTK